MTVRPALTHFNQLVLVALLAFISACSSTKSLPPSNPPDLTQANIYVNQVAFDILAPKKAIIALPIGETARRFIVYQGSNVVYQGNLDAQPTFNEWGQGAQYYLADFSSVQRSGEFHVVVTTQKQQVTSASFTIKRNAYFTLTTKSLINYFKASRHTNPQDKAIRINNTERYVDVSGGWVNSGSNQNKYLSDFQHANFLATQQGAFAAWAMAKSYSKLSALYDRNHLTTALAEEVIWGADYLHRILDQDGYFYGNILNSQTLNNEDLDEERLIAAYDYTEEVYTNNYPAAFREGAGIAIAALARAYELSNKTGIQGEFSAKQYLIDAERAFAHLQQHNLTYLDNGKENIIDDYTALIAATELYRITKKSIYLQVARQRAHKLNNRMTPQGFFTSDDNERPFYHGAEAGLPIIALIDYLTIERTLKIQNKTKRTIKLALDYQLALNTRVTNPFNLARQNFKVYQDNIYSKEQEGFFMPHVNDENNWWQGENSRIASLSTAAIWGGQQTHNDRQGTFGVNDEVAHFAQSQIDWIMGSNPYKVSMLYGFGVDNPPHAISAGTMLNGGISNGITGATLDPNGYGITWAEGPDENNWRWLQQRLENTAWYLLAITAMTEQ
ncbi:glycoside hydrolase family 9 protein [Colwellia sp. E2M01]|uniref:glycoside hydrolase family 9 protein n=1 Tax=Colwellia sp. E2M01 TaxID=2841561 RepID=UPI001C091432|nr:glycoside hydrolase family 9 protein [Colwellia sp. E2M01]MBU2872038.1 glycoside hydrolase family 9 protein [Colwellia sp. E2M01]